MKHDEAVGTLEQMLFDRQCDDTHDRMPDREEALSFAIEHLKRFKWRLIENEDGEVVAPHDTDLLLHCPGRSIYNPKRVELGCAISKEAGSRHSWATHFMPLPDGPEKEAAASADAEAASGCEGA